ncbi:MAG: hypothetical protein ACI4MF_10745 [Candidatus Faecivicinus sp.]
MRRGQLRILGLGGPLAALLAAALGQSGAAMKLMCAAIAVRACSLGAPEALGRSISRLISERKVAGTLLLALGLVGIAAGAGIFFAPVLAGALGGALGAAEVAHWIGAGAILAAVKCLEERFAGQGDAASAALTDALTGIAMAMCLLSAGDDPSRARACCWAGGAVLALSGLILLVFRRREWPAGSAALFRDLPVGLLRVLLYPALCLLAAEWRCGAPAGESAVLAAGFFAGLAVMELGRSTFRRSHFEAGGFKRWMAAGMLAISAGMAAVPLLAEAGMALALSWGELAAAAGLVLLAGGCAMALYGPADWNGIAGAAVLFVAAAVSFAGAVPEMGGYPAGLLAGPAAGAVLCLLMIPEWCDLRRRVHANRMRRRARRRAGNR